jgi:NADPH:quinone reductase-like Zn-dependent oxidoreductase
MKAIVQDAYGSANVLKLREIDKPVAGDDEVLVRVHTAGVDQGVWHQMAGLPYLFRIAGIGVRAPKNSVLGHDVAGRVEVVGAKVTGFFQPSDEVFGTCRGSFAEYACARADRLAPKPANLSFEQAAAVPTSGATALQALREKGRVRPGHRVLIIGAGGGVGTFAVQLAKADGAEVTGVCSTTKTDLVRSIGADRVIDYTREDFADGRNRYDLILDIAGNRSLSYLRRALAPEGTLVIVGGEGGGRWLGGIDRQLRAQVLSLLVRQKLGTLISTARQGDLQVLHELLAAGTVTPVIRQDVPAQRGPRRDPVPQRRTSTRQSRHHRLRRHQPSAPHSQTRGPFVAQTQISGSTQPCGGNPP